MAPCRGLYPFADRMFRPRKKSTPRPPQSIPHQPRSPPPIRHTRSPQSGHQAAGRTEPRLRPHPPATPTVGIGNDGDFTCHTRSRPTPATPAAAPPPPRPQPPTRHARSLLSGRQPPARGRRPAFLSTLSRLKTGPEKFLADRLTPPPEWVLSRFP